MFLKDSRDASAFIGIVIAKSVEEVVYFKA